MIDAEVMRLRQLRETALRARAVARGLGGGGRRLGQGEESFAALCRRAALQCWQIARLVTGTLRAHPYPPFQRDVGAATALGISSSAAVQAGVALHRRRALPVLDEQLLRVARQLADARALTWHQDLSDVLGRLQGRLAILSQEVAEAAQQDAEAHGRRLPAQLRMTATLSPAHAAPPPAASGSSPPAFDETWPYLAL